MSHVSVCEHIVQGTDYVVLALCAEGRIRYANPAAERLLGKDQVVPGRRLEDVIVSEERGRWPVLWSRWLAADGPSSAEELSLHDARGDVCRTLWRPVRWPAEGGESSCLALIGEVRKASTGAEHSPSTQRTLAAIARLCDSTSALAHEIKNPITAVHLALRALSKKLGQDEHEVLDDFVTRLKRVEQSLRQTLAEARPAGGEEHPS